MQDGMTPDPDRIAWIAADWGTTHLRLAAMGRDNAVLATRQSDRGMARLAPGEFEPALLALAEGWLAPGRVTVVMACGMVGSRQGWVDAPYRAVPCAPLSQDGLITAPCRDPRLLVRITPGLMQEDPPDVMRGEETQIAGFLALEPGFSGVVCLPGTHSKWARLHEGQVVSFRTFITGELFALLAEQSVLRHTVGGAGWDEDSFIAALDEVIAEPGDLTARLFGLRAAGLIRGITPEAARSRLSGLVIGAELAAAWMYCPDHDAAGSRDVIVIGAEAIAGAYRTGLGRLGLGARLLDGQQMTLAGLGLVRPPAVREVR